MSRLITERADNFAGCYAGVDRWSEVSRVISNEKNGLAHFFFFIFFAASNSVKIAASLSERDKNVKQSLPYSRYRAPGEDFLLQTRLLIRDLFFIDMGSLNFNNNYTKITSH